MKHNNISIFIPHAGCKNSCSFCNQRVISGANQPPTAKQVRETLTTALSQVKNPRDTEIAFFGGSFTAIERNYMLELLKVANEFIGKDKFYGIRISTRPDAIDEETLYILDKYNVTAIELGAQSMSDEVLDLNDRGHKQTDVINASTLIRQFGFELGLQMMVGLYGDNYQNAINTAEQFIKIKPDTVRIYPTVILKGTRLEQLYFENKYKPISLNEAVLLCSKLLKMFEQNNINVIKLGLHASKEVEKDMVAGIYHPAFRELCEGQIYFENALEQLANKNCSKIILQVNSSAISKMVGQRKTNIKNLVSMGYTIRVEGRPEIPKYEVVAKEDV